MSQTKSPFKFLDSYQQDDVDVYFGRKNETRDLYKALQGVKHLLLFGPSGSGKTSLIECGLRNQFSEAAWFALSVRRGQNIVQSVFARINEVLAEKLPLDAATQLPTNPDFGFGQAVERLFAERYQPVYLLFDQFEELLLLGAEGEKRDFFTCLQQLIEYKTPCRVLLVMREEFIGHLSEWEAICPSIFQHRFRLEKMGRSNVQTVIQQILEADKSKSQFQTQQPEMLAAAILSKLPDTQREIELAHVQVFLDELWHRAAGQTDPGEQPLLQSNLVRKDDDLERILDSFLKKQLRELAPAHGDKLPLELLATLITERHTKLQASPAEMGAALVKNSVALTQPLAVLLRDLEQRRILRALKVGEQKQYEISHDVLARVVGGNLTEEMKLRERAREVYRVYQERKGLFSREDLDYLRPFEGYLEMPEELKGRMVESENLIFERLEWEKVEIDRRRRKAFWTASVAILAALVAIGVAAWAFSLKNKAIAAEAQTKTALDKADKLVNAFYFYADRFALAFKADQYYFIDKNGAEVTKLGKWEKVVQFDDYGLAKVSTNEKMFLLDTMGNTFLATSDFNAISTEIEAIIISGKRFSNIPKSVFQQDSLKILLADLNELKSIPMELCLLKKLKILDLNFNEIENLPIEIARLDKLTTLRLYGNNIKNIPPEFGNLKELKVLDLGANQLTDIPDEFGNLKNLEDLSLSVNPIKNLSPHIGYLKNLKIFEMGGNGMENIPKEIGMLTSLKNLTLSGNNLKEIPKEIGHLINIVSINLRMNDLSSIPREVGELSKLSYLDLEHNNLTSLPIEIKKLYNLIELDLGGNNIIELPDEITALTKLRYLNLQFNNIAMIPDRISELRSLKELKLNGNQLSKLPKGIGELTNLVSLELNWNQITNIPAEIGNLKNLKELSCKWSKLTSLPSSISELNNLRYLDLEGNPIQESEREKIRKLVPVGCVVIF